MSAAWSGKTLKRGLLFSRRGGWNAVSSHHLLTSRGSVWLDTGLKNQAILMGRVLRGWSWKKEKGLADEVAEGCTVRSDIQNGLGTEASFA